MSLATGKQFCAFNCTELPNDDCIIDKVEYMERYDKQPIMTDGYTIFERATGVYILDDD